MKLYVTDDVTIDFIQFKNVKIAIDRNICVFISGINKDNNIKVHKYVRKKLLQKFKVYAWDFIGYDKNMLHIKFLVKYSPILSKFIDDSEFDIIELISSSNRIINDWGNVSYINFNDGKEFFNINDISCAEQDTISIKIDSEFLKILERR